MVNRFLSRLAWLTLATGLAACNGGLDSGSGLEGTWRLVRLQKSGAPAVEVKEPDSFTADFGSDGRVHLMADCNRCNAGYVASGGGLDVEVMGCTRAYCATAPLDTDFAGLVSGATAWSVAGSRLTLTSTEGTLHLER